MVVPSKDKKVITVTNAFEQILDEPNRKASKIWVNKEGGFYSRSMRSWLQKVSDHVRI